MSVEGLLRLRQSLGVARRAAELAPLDQVQWLPLQASFLRSRAKSRMIRAGNQSLGKTWASMAEVIWHCLGRHPYKPVPNPPVEWWVICASWSQSLAIQEKIANFLHPSMLIPGHRSFDAAKGYGQSPVIQFGNGSVIRIKTSNQDGLDLAGATIDGVVFDEPPRSSRVYAEVSRRVQSRGGSVLFSMTPINAPVEWIRELVETGQIEDHHSRLTPEALIPVGRSHPIRTAAGEVCDAVWIEKIEASALSHERPVVVHGEWETRVEGRLFTEFVSTEDGHLTRHLPAGDLKVVLGIDYGTGAHNQVATLVAIDDRNRKKPPVIYVIGETTTDGHATTPDQDADRIMAMLRVWGLSWHDLHRAHGDIPAGHGVARKGNRDIGDAVARKIGKQRYGDLNPRIRTAKMGRGNARGAVAMGERWLHQQMVRGHFFVHVSCVGTIECFDRYDGAKQSSYKHRIDAIRYALKDQIMGRDRRTATKLVNG